MKRPSLPAVASLLLWFGTANAGWYLDESCHEIAGDAEHILQSAFDLAATGSTTLKQVIDPYTGTTDDEAQVYRSQVDLVHYIFQEMKDGEVNHESPEYTTVKEILE